MMIRCIVFALLALAPAWSALGQAAGGGQGGRAVQARSNAGPTFDVSRPPYNARGDGVADDTASIQAAVWDALRYVTFRQPGDTRADGQITAKVWIPATRNHYRLTRPIYLSGRNVSVEIEEGAQIANSDTPWPLFNVGYFPAGGVPLAHRMRWEPGRYFAGTFSRPSAHPSQALDGVSGLDASIAPDPNAWRGWRARSPDRNCRYRLVITNPPTAPNAATYTLRFRPAAGAPEEVTAPLAWDAPPARVQAALEALPSIGRGQVRCRAGARLRPDHRDDDVEVEFVGKFANQFMTAGAATLAVAATLPANPAWGIAAQYRVAGGPMPSSWVIPACGVNAGVDRSLMSEREFVTFDFAARWPKNRHAFQAGNDLDDQSILRGGTWGRPIDAFFLNDTFNFNFTLNNYDPMKGRRPRYEIRAALPRGQQFRGVVRVSVQFDFTQSTWEDIITLWLGNDNKPPRKVAWGWLAPPPFDGAIPRDPVRFYEEMDLPPMGLGSDAGQTFLRTDGYEILGLAVDGRRRYDPASAAQVRHPEMAAGPVDDAYRYSRSSGDLNVLLAMFGGDVARHDGDVAKYGGHDYRYSVVQTAGYESFAIFWQLGRAPESTTFTTESVAIRGSRPGAKGVGGAILRPGPGSMAIVTSHSLFSQYENLWFARGLVGMYRTPPNIGNYGNRIANIESNVAVSLVCMPFQGFLTIDNVFIPGGCRLQPFTLAGAATMISRVILMDVPARRVAYLSVGDSSDLIVRDVSLSTEHVGLADCWFYIQRGEAFEAHVLLENVRGNPTGTRTILKLDDVSAAGPIGVVTVEASGVSPTRLNYGTAGEPTIITNGSRITGRIVLPVRSNVDDAGMPRHQHIPVHGKRPNFRVETWPVGDPPVGGKLVAPAP